MRAVVQRVKSASVMVGNDMIAKIGKGLVALIGIEAGDTFEDANYITEKIVTLRIFEDEQGKMNRSVQKIEGDIILVSQFTLLGDARKGRRPSFTQAASPEDAKILYNYVVDLCSKKVKRVETGEFQAEMLVNILNDGPVTILLDSKKQF
ncbi:MAG: D-aminoacyl-tRNA deacylase [Tepidanaerobacteraceae bacterium]|jgi:D-tyrosyl-tRNA(Tyr) deacylase